MLITQLKPTDEILSLAEGKTVTVSCAGCSEIFFPAAEVEELINCLLVSKTVLATVSTDYLCSGENLESWAQSNINKIDAADTLLVFSCGVGVQVIAERFPDKRVFAVCDTYPLPGCQGVTPLEFGCALCGECHLNDTGGICPISSCAKGLVNGPCGGSKNGKCEVCSDIDCGWALIFRQLEKTQPSDIQTQQVKIRDFALQGEDLV
ncbi:MAG: methylenetetrahydrofolate reductase C-terminal domain-containing protein [Oscillospiraceae bacterium]|nr:methylenetetrahydrofolate reductase C-terminal domain-containing protein [Oscillospiraceae bacterium]